MDSTNNNANQSSRAQVLGLGTSGMDQVNAIKSVNEYALIKRMVANVMSKKVLKSSKNLLSFSWFRKDDEIGLTAFVALRQSKTAHLFFVIGGHGPFPDFSASLRSRASI